MSSDRFFELSLRILTVAIALVLAGSVAFLAQRLRSPAPPAGPTVPLTQVQPAPVTPAPAARPAAEAQVLLAPGRVFRCVEQGRVSFSDRPCLTAD